MAIAYYGSQISPHMDITPEGFLVCRGVPINRIGDQRYFARELRLDGDPERIVNVHRYPEDVFSPAALASFEAKDVTQGHPPESVTPANYSLYSKGHCENVRRSGDFTLADLVIKDAALISDIRNGVIRQVSCGYTCEYVPDGDGYRQTNIQGNHIAVVLRGRAGSEVSIHDSAGSAGKGENVMSKFTQAILSAFGMAAKEAATQEEIDSLISTAATVLDADPSAPAASEPVPAPAPTADAMAGRPAAADELAGKLDKVIEMLGSLQHGGGQEGGQPAGDKLDSLEKLLSGKGKEGEGEDAVTIPADKAADACLSPGAKDAALSIVRAMRPVVASIQDKGIRDRVTDAMLSAFRGPDVMGAIDAAARTSARKAADQAAVTSYEQRCADSEAAYAARNPHKRQEKEA